MSLSGLLDNAYVQVTRDEINASGMFFFFFFSQHVQLRKKASFNEWQ